ncbi:MAG: hypothetical protein GX620_16465 [Chloroflexi bacterium]|nr:hypothetical protein [Chloroflexota bacterium]
MTEQTMRLRMLRQVALRADGFYDTAQNLGKKAAGALTDKKRSQISGLEGIANSALKTTDVFDFVKLRTARQKEWREGDWGAELLRFISRDLRLQRKEICNALGIDSESHDGLEVHLLLIREFVRQLAAHYEYACVCP